MHFAMIRNYSLNKKSMLLLTTLCMVGEQRFAYASVQSTRRTLNHVNIKQEIMSY